MPKFIIFDQLKQRAKDGLKIYNFNLLFIFFNYNQRLGSQRSSSG